MSQSNRTFRLFISSTFSDLKAERNAMQERVFPKLRTLCLQYGARFQAIDLRWGVSEEAALDQQTMKICLGEIDRCRAITPRPYLVVLLGDRYGWRPPPPEVPEDEFKTVLDNLSYEPDKAAAERELLERWYRRDDNAVPAIYNLVSRSGEYEAYESWWPVEVELQRIMSDAVGRSELAGEQRLKFEASATEQEIVHGAFNVPDAPEHVYCFLREIESLPDDDSAGEFVDLDDAGKPDRVLHDKVKDLKRRLHEYLPNTIHEYKAQWDGDGISTGHIDQWCDDVYNALSKLIVDQITLDSQASVLAREITAHEDFAVDRAKFFTGRGEELNSIGHYLYSDARTPMLIAGDSGSGKSALMACALGKTRKSFDDALVAGRFIGATPTSCHGLALLDDLCNQICNHYDVDRDFGVARYEEVVEEFHRRLTLATEKKPLVIFIDALDQLNESDQARDLAWLPEALPEHVRLIVSTVEGTLTDALRLELPESCVLMLGPMPPADAKQLFARWLYDAGRTLQQHQWQAVMYAGSQCGMPLYLRLLFELARQWTSFETTLDIRSDTAGMIRALFERLGADSQHGEVIVSRTLCYLTLAKNGMTEDELLDVLWEDFEVVDDFYRRSPKSPPVDHMPIVVWSRLYFDLAPYLTERTADGTTLFTFYHRQLGGVVRDMFLDDNTERQRHWNLAHYFKEQPLYLEQQNELRVNLRKLSELPYQQAHGKRWDNFYGTMTDIDFLHAKIKEFGPQAIGEDFERINLDCLASDRERKADDVDVLRVLAGAIQLSAYVLSVDPYQLPGQLVGRLTGHRSQAIRDLLVKVLGWSGHIWMRPATKTLMAPGGALVRTLLGHSNDVQSVAVSKDGRFAVSASKDASVRVWNLQTGLEQRSLKGHTRATQAVAITPDGRKVVSGGNDSTIRVWDIESGRELRVLREHTEAVNCLAISADGSRMVSGSTDQTLRFWSFESGQEIARSEGHSGEVWSVAITPDLRYAISGGMDHTVRVWDLSTGKHIRTIEGHAGSILAVLAMADGKRVISASADRTIRVWDIATGTQRMCLDDHQHYVTSLSLTSDERYLVSGSADRTLCVWDMSNGKHMSTLGPHTEAVRSVAVLPGDKHVVSAAADKTMKVWFLHGGVTDYYPRAHDAAVNSVCVSPDGRVAASASADATIKLWNIRTGLEERTLTDHDSEVKAVAITPNGKHLISGSRDATVRIWDMAGVKPTKVLKGHESEINALSISENGKYMATGGANGSLRFWNLASFWPGFMQTLFKHRLAAVGHTDAVSGLALTQNGRRIISVSADQMIRMWKPTKKKSVHYLRGIGGAMWAVAVTPDGTKAVCGGASRTLLVWDLSSRLFGFIQRWLQIGVTFLDGHTDWIITVAVMPDSRHAVSGSSDSTVRVWDLQEGHEVATLKGHTAAVREVLVTADGSRIVSISQDKSIKLWDAQSYECLATYTAEAPFKRAAVTPDGKAVIAGDQSGLVHIVQIIEQSAGEKKVLDTFEPAHAAPAQIDRRKSPRTETQSKREEKEVSVV